MSMNRTIAVRATALRLVSTVVPSLVVALMAVGCGGEEGPPREPVAGVVTLDGRPLEKGMITFTPEAGGDLIVSALIVDGAFDLPRPEGPGLGTHRVEIRSKKATGKQLKDRDDPDNVIEEIVEQIPSRYNLRSVLKADVAAGGDNRFSYDLTGGKDRDRDSTKKLASRRP